MTEIPLFEKLGGESALRDIIGEFIDRVFADVMIGFFFRDADKGRIKDKEYELAAQFLGAGIEYTGRALRPAHSKHKIFGGHFMRRKKILEDVLREKGAPEEVIVAWLADTESQRDQVTGDRGSECH